jgi:hypothetical protein
MHLNGLRQDLTARTFFTEKSEAGCSTGYAWSTFILNGFSIWAPAPALA